MFLLPWLIPESLTLALQEGRALQISSILSRVTREEGGSGMPE